MIGNCPFSYFGWEFEKSSNSNTNGKREFSPIRSASLMAVYLDKLEFVKLLQNPYLPIGHIPPGSRNNL